MNQDNKLDLDTTLISMKWNKKERSNINGKNLMLHDWEKTDWINYIVNNKYE